MIAQRRRVYLLDVEGTIAPISLVSEQLFPYARRHFPNFLMQNIDDPAVRADLRMLSVENCAETDAAAPRMPNVVWTDYVDGPLFRDHASIYALWLMDRDRKSTALKSLQGKIWKAGFESGELKGTLFADVPAALERWAARGRVAIYSSGSVEAQQLLFRHSVFGDLTGLIAGHFDTRTGAKMESASYAAIAAAMSAAREAGCETRLVTREGNAPVEDPHGHRIIDSFEGLL